MALAADFVPTAQQAVAIEKTAQWYRDLKAGLSVPRSWRYVGYSGVGKTTSAVAAIEECGLTPGSSKVAAGAHTGKASLRLRTKGVPASTWHSQMYIPIEKVAEREQTLREEISRLQFKIEYEDGGESARQALAQHEKTLKDVIRGKSEMDYVLDPESALHDVEMIFCDESSMMGGQIQRDLESFGKPIIWCGDNFQLGPVEKGASALFDGRGRPLPPDVLITEIVRQAKDSPIVQASMRLREQQDIAYGKYGSGDNMLLVVPPDKIQTEHLVMADQVIAAFNTTRHDVNREVRDALGRTSLFPVTGDKLICLRNDKMNRLFNGLQGEAMTVARMYGGEQGSRSFKLDFRDDEEGITRAALDVISAYFTSPGDPEAVAVLPGWMRKKFSHFDYGYCITGHKSQGSEWDRTLVFVENYGNGNMLEWFRWYYTTLTRARKVAVIAV